MWAGTYQATGTWNISGPLAGGRTVGDAVADLLLEELVAACGAPSFVQEEVEDALGSLVREDLKGTVDTHVPEQLAPGGSLTVALADTLADVQVESTIELGGDSEELSGRETVDGLRDRTRDPRWQPARVPARARPHQDACPTRPPIRSNLGGALGALGGPWGPWG